MVCMLFLDNDVSRRGKDGWKSTAQKEYLKVENVVQVRNSNGSGVGR